MSSEEIIGQLAKDKKIEELIKNISKTSDISQKHLDDLAQDTYVTLLEKPPELIVDLYDKEQLIYYIARILVNNIHSNLSPYYYRYIKPEKHEELRINPIDQE